MMELENTLEEDILKVLWGSSSSLNVLEIWEALDEEEIKVPINYLDRVLNAMVCCELVEPAGNRGDYLAYRPVLALTDFYQRPLKVIQIGQYKRKNQQSE